eukprot:m.356484 g.356484  ORF g.356484 m.356484 type:complete len:56 (+) comp90946_c0_seq1:28-195(+)
MAYKAMLEVLLLLVSLPVCVATTSALAVTQRDLIWPEIKCAGRLILKNVITVLIN